MVGILEEFYPLDGGILEEICPLDGGILEEICPLDGGDPRGDLSPEALQYKFLHLRT